jgi:hypothetical protein
MVVYVMPADVRIPLKRALKFVSLGCALVLAGAALPVHALSVIAPTFDELVRESTQILRVEVISLSAQLDPSDSGPVIHTFVRCRVLRRLKGASTDGEITLRLQGGQVGALHMEVPGMPKFRAGERCLLFVTGNGTSACPLVGVMHGCYRLASNPATGREQVLRENRTPLRAADEVVLPLVALPAQDNSVSRGLALGEFEEAIAARMQAQAADVRTR